MKLHKLSIKLFFFLATALLFVSSCQLKSKQPQSIVALAERVQNGLSEHFIFELMESPNEQFEISNKGSKIVVRGSTLNSITAGLGWYLKYYCNSGTFWTVKRNPIPVPLPKVNGKIVHQTSMKHRYYFNYCCDRYSYRYWDWTRWEQEVDWMALNGINIALIIIDRAAVLWKVCESYGVRETVNRYYGNDRLMPHGQCFFQLHQYEMSQLDSRVRLQQTVIARMRDLGINPLLDGFKGIVPKQLTETMKNVKFFDGGVYNNTTKEPVIDISDPFFEEFGTKYYQLQKKLYGDQLFIDADPIIEGTGPAVDFGDLGLKIQNLILNTYPDATWVLQGWAGNPRDELLTKTDAERTLILDLACEYRPQWNKREIHSTTPWVFSLLNNYGGKTGLYGNLDNIFDQQAEAKSLPPGKFLHGVGALLEGIENNPVVWNALFESAWMDAKPEMDRWIQDYAKGRYGKRNDHAEKAWDIIYKKIYSTTRNQVVGATENIMCARPKLELDRVWRGCTSVPYFTNEDIFTAWDEMLLAADELGVSDGYQLDLVELTREIISNYAWELYPKVIAAHQRGDKMMFDRLSEQFLELFDDMELILSTRKEFMLATWIERHRSWGRNEPEMNYFERAAKSILTIYSDIPTLETRLHDYAHRELSGTMKDFYKPRFEKYFSELRKTTDKNAEPKIDWFEFDHKWTVTPSNYMTNASCCPVDACKVIHDKYRNQIN